MGDHRFFTQVSDRGHGTHGFTEWLGANHGKSLRPVSARPILMNLAGLLLFAEQPERFMTQFILKAVRYPENEIHIAVHLDADDFAGPLTALFDEAIAFILRNLHRIQAGRGVNTPGVPEISGAVSEGLLVNAPVHRGYLVSAPIRLFVFDNRIEIIRPGNLPNAGHPRNPRVPRFRVQWPADPGGR